MPILALLCLATLAACASGGAAFEFYVVIRPDETGKFIAAVTSIAKEDGLETAVGQTRFDAGNALRVVEGRGRGLTLWAQNTVLSGNEDPKLCGAHPEPYPDPAQFIVFTEPRFWGFSTRKAAAELGEKVLSQLHHLGFDVRRAPVVCGASIIHDGA